MANGFQLNQYSVQVEGVKLCVRSTNQTQKPVLYCLHGGPGFDSLSLISGILPLARIFDLRFVDLRGNGASSDPVDGDYSLDAYTRDILSLIQQETNGRPVGVLGHSFGGWVAIRLLAQNTRPVDFGILCSTPFDTAFQPDFSKAIENAKDLEVARTQNAFDIETATDEDFRKLSLGLRSIYFPELDSKQAADLMKPWTYRIKPHRYADRIIFPDVNLRDQLRAIRVPCLVVGGNMDPITSPTYLTRYSDLLRKGTLKMISGAGHFSFLTAPERFAYQVSQWWEFNQTTLQTKGIQS